MAPRSRTRIWVGCSSGHALDEFAGALQQNPGLDGDSTAEVFASYVGGHGR